MADLVTINAENIVSPYDFDSLSVEGSMSFAPDAAAKCHGNYGFKIIADGTNDEACGVVDLTSQSVLYCRSYVYVPTGFEVQAATGTVIFTDFKDTVGANAARCGIRGSASSTPNQWVLYFQSAGQYSATLTLDTWHFIELYYLVAADVGGAALYVDGSQILSDLDQTVTMNVRHVRSGFVATGDVSPNGDYCYMDDIKMATTGPIGAYVSSPTIMSGSDRRRRWYR